MKKILMLLADGFEEIEALGVTDILRRCDISVELCSTTGDATVTSSRGVKIISDTLFPVQGFSAADYAGIILPGGLPNAHTLRDDPRVIETVRAFFASGKFVCAICAAPCVLERAGILKGKEATSYPGCIEESGCRYSEARVVRDETVITSRGPGTACEFGFAVAEALGCGEKAKSVYRAMLM